MMKDFLRDAMKDGMSADEIRAIVSLVEEEVQAEADIRAEAKRARIAAAKEGLISAYACYLTEADIMTKAEVAQIDWKRFDSMLDDMAASVKNMKDLSKSFKVVKIGHDDEALDLKGVLDKLGLL